MSRTIVFGDIHGALKALKQLMAEIDIRQEYTLVFLGDYVDGWSESAQVIEYFIQLEKTRHCIFLKGNHDAWCEEWLMGNVPDEEWLFHGGQATVESYANLTLKERAIHLEFFNRMRSYYVDDNNRLFIHAGFSSMHGPGKEHYESNYFWDRTLWETALAMCGGMERDSEFYPRRLLLYTEIYIGHTPTLNYGVNVPMHAANVWNIDTGAAFQGKLTALNVDTKEFWQSSTVQHLYPNEKGRHK